MNIVERPRQELRPPCLHELEVNTMFVLNAPLDHERDRVYVVVAVSGVSPNAPACFRYVVNLSDGVVRLADGSRIVIPVKATLTYEREM